MLMYTILSETLLFDILVWYCWWLIVAMFIGCFSEERRERISHCSNFKCHLPNCVGWYSKLFSLHFIKFVLFNIWNRADSLFSCSQLSIWICGRYDYLSLTYNTKQNK